MRKDRFMDRHDRSTVFDPESHEGDTTAHGGTNLGWFNVREYGAKGNGSTDDSVAIDAALSDMTSGGTLYFPAGHYIDTSFRSFSKTITIRGEGTQSNWDVSGAPTQPLSLVGTLEVGTFSRLAFNATVDRDDATVDDGSVFSVGDWVKITSSAKFNEVAPSTAPATLGEINRIESINGNILTFYWDLQDTYLVADTGLITLVTMVDGVSIQDIRMTGRGAGAGNWAGIKVQYVTNFYVKNFTFEDGYTACLTLTDVVRGRIEGSAFGPAIQTGLGYGLQVTGSCQGITMYGNNFRRCRHALSLGGTTPQRGIVFANNIHEHSEHWIGAIGGHNTYDGLVVANNVIRGDGIGYFSGKNTTVQDNEIYNVRADNGGILINNTATGHTQIHGNFVQCPSTTGTSGICIQNKCHNDASIINNYCIGATTFGVVLSNGEGSHTVYRNNVIECTVNGPCLRISNGNAPQGPTENITIAGNVFKMNYTGISIDPTNQDIENVTISDNDFWNGSNAALLPEHNEATEAIHFKIFGNRLNGCGGGFGTTGMRYVDIHDNDFRDITNNAISIRPDIDANVDFVNAWRNHFKNCGTDINYGTGQLQTTIVSRQNLDTFPHVLAADDDYVHAGVNGTGSPRLVNSNITNPDVPRTVTFRVSDNDTPSGDMEIVGIDARGYPITVTITLSAGATVETDNAFATVSEYTIPAGVGAADAVFVGIGDKLGLSNWVWASDDVYKVSKEPAFSAVSVYLGGNQAIVDSTPETLELDTEVFDTKSEWDTGAYRFTADDPGRYIVVAQAHFQMGGNPEAIVLSIFKGGAAVASIQLQDVTGQAHVLTVSKVLDLDVNDFIEIEVVSVGFNDTIDAGILDTFCTIHQLSANQEDITIPAIDTTYHTIDFATIIQGESYSVWYRTSLNFHD